jgi:hypothetical protein
LHPHARKTRTFIPGACFANPAACLAVKKGWEQSPQSIQMRPDSAGDAGASKEAARQNKAGSNKLSP